MGRDVGLMQNGANICAGIDSDGGRLGKHADFIHSARRPYSRGSSEQILTTYRHRFRPPRLDTLTLESGEQSLGHPPKPRGASLVKVTWKKRMFLGRSGLSRDGGGGPRALTSPDM